MAFLCPRYRSVGLTMDSIMSFDSNTIRLQTSHSNFYQAGEPEIEERRHPRLMRTDSFEDRHYRPGLGPVSTAEEIRSFERSDVSTSIGRYPRPPSPGLRKPASPPSSELHMRPKEIPREQEILRILKSAPLPNSTHIDLITTASAGHRLLPLAVPQTIKQARTANGTSQAKKCRTRSRCSQPP